MQKGTCSVAGCNKPNVARNLCGTHYARWARNGDPGEAELRCAMPGDGVQERLERRGWTVTASGCHEWNGTRLSNGYGTVVLPGRQFAYVHRVRYALEHGEIPDGMSVCHRCDNPPCCNPDHLFLGPHVVNMRDSVTKRRHAYGERNGHAKLTAENVREIRQLLAAGELSQAAIGARYGVGQSAVYMIASGKSWKLVT